MAGIGFKLRDTLTREDYSGLLRAYLVSGLIASGPWIISILAMAALSVLLHPHIGGGDMSAFSASVTHVYALGLILAGPVQLVIVRYAADRMNESEKDKVFPSFIASLAIMMPLAAIAGFVLFFVGAAELSLAYRFGGLAMLVFTTAVFITASYLTSFQNYRALLLGFIVGYASSGYAAYYLGVNVGADWALVGFAAGHGLLFFLLFFQFSREFGGRETISWQVLKYFLRFPELALAGLLYNLGIWIDKILFWQFSEQSQTLAGWISASPEYDMAISLGLLSIVPGMAVFMLKLETDFALAYERFHKALSGNGSRADIQRSKGSHQPSPRPWLRLSVQSPDRHHRHPHPLRQAHLQSPPHGQSRRQHLPDRTRRRLPARDVPRHAHRAVLLRRSQRHRDLHRHFLSNQRHPQPPHLALPPRGTLRFRLRHRLRCRRPSRHPAGQLQPTPPGTPHPHSPA